MLVAEAYTTLDLPLPSVGFEAGGLLEEGARRRSVVARVAGRDTESLPAGPLLVAKVGSDVRAAISLADGTVIADPFHRTAELVEMLKIRTGAGTRAHNRHIAPLLRRSRRAPLTATRAA